MSLKEKLLKSELADFSLPGHDQRKLINMIRFGVYAEIQDDFYLFIYRDLLRSAGYYGVILFLNQTDNDRNPFTTICFEENGKERYRKVYVKTALYFLKNNLGNTLEIKDKPASLYSIAHQKISSLLLNNSYNSTKIQNYDFSPDSEKITFKKQNPVTLTDSSVGSKLQPVLSALENSAQLVPLPKKDCFWGMAGIIDESAFTTGKELLLFPVVLSKHKKNPRFNDFKLYDSSTLPENFKTLIYKIQHLEKSEHFNQTQIIKIINSLYLKELFEIFYALLDDFKFIHLNLNSKSSFLKFETFIFIYFRISFSPSQINNNHLTINLTLTNRFSNTVKSDEEIIIKKCEGKFLIFFKSTDNKYYLASPDSPENFEPVLNFLKFSNKYHFSEFKVLNRYLTSLQSKFIEIDNQISDRYIFNLRPEPELAIFTNPDSNLENLSIRFDYNSPINTFLSKNPQIGAFAFQKNIKYENLCHKLLDLDPKLSTEIKIEKQINSIEQFYYFKSNSSSDWLISMGDFYLKKGFKIYLEKEKKYLSSCNSNLNFKTNKSKNWLEITTELQSNFGERYLSVIDFNPQDKYILDQNNNLHLINTKDIEKLKIIHDYSILKNNKFFIPSKNHVILDKLSYLDLKKLPSPQNFENYDKLSSSFKKIKDYPLSNNFKGILRNYQKNGFNWMMFLNDYSLSGCLADDMGLGKTVQTLALIQSLIDLQKIQNVLLVVPVSTIPNWKQEITKFTPALSVYIYIGTTRDIAILKKYQIIITSYETLRNDIDLLKSTFFSYTILDESQKIKNSSSQIAKSVTLINTGLKLALSGTPIENNCLELWSLFQFLSPGYLGSLKWFKEKFFKPIENNNSEVSKKLLKKMIFPYILRRNKELVAQDLPPKTQIITKIDMNDQQKELYTTTALSFKKIIANDFNSKSVSQLSMKIFEAILRLRQICLFPSLLPGNEEIPSAKFDFLMELLSDVYSENHKALIFSQFTGVLKKIKNHFDLLKIPYSYLDGSLSVDKRQIEISKFQTKVQIKNFLISLKAGGLGLNLTAADFVFIFDPWWNPALESQAVDRAHRIGQNKKIFVYKLIIQNSIEEKILELQKSKQKLFNELIYTDRKSFKDLTKENILNLFC